MTRFEERAARVVLRGRWPDNPHSDLLGRVAVTLARRLDAEPSTPRRLLLESVLRGLSEFDHGPPDQLTLLRLRTRARQLSLDPRAELPALFEGGSG